MMRNERVARILRRSALAFLPTFLLLLTGEIGIRGYYFFHEGKDLAYLITPWGGSIKKIRTRAIYPYAPRKTYTQTDSCSGREITFTVNRQGGRGPEWELKKSPGVIRVVVVGGSSTFGVTNPDHATWPVFLEEALRARWGQPVEVFNAGQPGYALVDFTQFFIERLREYRPDMVIYYEGWNDTDLPLNSEVHHRVRRFHENTVTGHLSEWLYCRSMLYTYLLEKIQFVLASRGRRMVPRVDRFRMDLERFVKSVMQEDALPVLVMQVLEPHREASVQKFQQALRRLDLKDTQAIKGLILEGLGEKDPLSHGPLARLRVHQAQVLVEVVRRTGEAFGLQVIDPIPTFSQDRGTDALFCDVVHLTDRGNRLLAETVAEHLVFPPSRMSRASHPMGVSRLTRLRE